MKDFLEVLASKAFQDGWDVQRKPVGIMPDMSGYAYSDSDGEFDIQLTYSSYHSPYYPWEVFDKSTQYWKANTASDEWLQIDLGDGKARRIEGYSIQGSGTESASPKHFKLEGSLDGTTWVTLDERTNEENWRNEEQRDYFFVNTVYYRYYRLYVHSTNGYGDLIIQEMDLLESTDDTAHGKYFMKSVGSSGSDNIVLYFDPHTIHQKYGNVMKIGYAEDYVEGDGFTNLYPHDYYFARSTNFTRNLTTVPVKYYIDINMDRILFATVLDDQSLDPANNACYLGLMDRFSNELDNSATVKAFGMYSFSGYPRVLRDKSFVYDSDINTKVVSFSNSPSVWGDVIFVSPIYLEADYEGVRGKLSECFTCRVENIVNEDEIEVGGVRYKAILLTNGGSNSFPYNCVLFKMPIT